MFKSGFGLATALIVCGTSVAALAAGTTYSTTYTFLGSNDGASPSAKLLYRQGMLYGTTQAGGSQGEGSIFSLNPATGVETVLYSFLGGADGYTPAAALVYKTGKLFGTTRYGGASGSAGCSYCAGTIFEIDLKTGKKRTLFKFPNSGSQGFNPGEITFVDGVMYGVTAGGGTDPNSDQPYGTIYTFDVKSRQITTLHTFISDAEDTQDGAFPESGLLYYQGKLYGSTQRGGLGAGTVYSYDIATKDVETLSSLTGTPDPSIPQSTPVYLNGAIYLTGVRGGAGPDEYGDGAIFKIDLTTLAKTIVYSFQGGTDGSSPIAGLTLNHGLFYGTTSAMGANNAGTAYSFDPKTNVETVLHQLGATKKDGAMPVAPLVDAGSVLYGNAFEGGTKDSGTVFKLTP